MSNAPERKQPGRKPLAEGEGKTARVELRVHDHTKAAWQAKAAAAGLTLQAWIEKRCNAAR
jgi:predicted DNA binding CopG/RHH family protein